jgi:hypothetical protein
MNTIEMVRGTTNSIFVTVLDDAGEPYQLKSGEKLIFGVKTNINNSDCCIHKVVTEGDGEYEIRLKPEDTENLPYGTFCYDVGLQVGEDYFPVIECSPFIVKHNVTKRVN